MDRTDSAVEQTLVLGCTVAPSIIPLRQMREFRVQDPRLDRIQSAVIPLHIVVVLLRLPMIADHADLGGECFVIGGHRSGFAAGAQVLSWIKAEGRRSSHGASFEPAIVLSREVFCAMGLARVLYNDQ